MRQRLLSTRAVVTRTSRSDARGAVLESVAAEFALLAQRRARMTRQIDLLQRQINAAAAGLNGVMARMTVLAQRIDAIDPGLRGRLAMPEPPRPSRRRHHRHCNTPPRPAYRAWRPRGRHQACARCGSRPCAAPTPPVDGETPWK